MLDFIQDDVTAFCLPDTAHCKLTGVNPLDMTECPEGCGHCSGDCLYYSEESRTETHTQPISNQ